MISGINRESADFIIVGAGSAGCTLYHQLAQTNPGRFLLIEAGGPPLCSSSLFACHHTPVHYPKLFRSRLDWNYQTLPQANLGNRKVNWPRGKGLGGSSLLNAMIYLPGSSGDWTALAQTWNISPGELRQHLPHQIPSALWHNASQPEIHPLSQTFLEACERKFHQQRCNFLNDNDYNFNVFPRNIHFGRRVNAYQAFVAVQAAAKKLSVVTDTIVERVLFDNHRAIAILCHSKGKPILYTAKHAIILCAGAIESPTLLMRSGVGDAAQLQSHGISIVQDLPGVGRNLQDHLLMPLIVTSNTASLAHRPTLEEKRTYRWTGNGSPASNIAEVGCFERFNSQRIPQLQVHFTPTHYLEYPIRSEPTQAMTLGLTLLQPQSRGHIQLNSTNPIEPPRIDPNYLAESADTESLVEGLVLCRELAASEPLATYRGQEILPGDKRTSPAALERAIRVYVQTVFHPVGTCAVGTDCTSVVDSNFRVHGVEGLYVVDGSVFDRIPACNPAAQIMALASLAATRIGPSLA